MSNPLGKGGILNLKGAKINHLEVLDRAPNKLTPNAITKAHIQWNCKCECGKQFIATTKQLRKGRKSCGCKSVHNRFRKSPSEEASIIIKVIAQYKRGALERNINWELTFSYCKRLLLSNCVYCGSKPSRTVSFFKDYEAIKVNGIDRIDNNLHYTEDNTVSCCKICNRAKSTLTILEFGAWVKQLVDYGRKIQDSPTKTRKK